MDFLRRGLQYAGELLVFRILVGALAAFCIGDFSEIFPMLSRSLESMIQCICEMKVFLPAVELVIKFMGHLF